MNSKLKLDYLDDIMSKANYGLMENELNCEEWLDIIGTITEIIKIKYNAQKGNENVA